MGEWGRGCARLLPKRPTAARRPGLVAAFSEYRMEVQSLSLVRQALGGAAAVKRHLRQQTNAKREIVRPTLHNRLGSLEPIVSQCSFNKHAAHIEAALNARPFCLVANARDAR